VCGANAASIVGMFLWLAPGQLIHVKVGHWLN